MRLFAHRPASLLHLALLLLVLSVGLFGCSGKHPPSKDPEKILRDMMQANNKATFTGVKKFEQRVGNQYFRFRMKIARQGAEQTRLEFLEPFGKRGQVIVKRGQQYWKMGVQDEEPLHYKRYGSHREMEIRNLALLLKNYQVRYLGTQPIARRRADIIQIVSRTDPATKRVLWVDTASRLPLQSEETHSTSAGQFAKRFSYEQIAFVRRLPEHLFRVPITQGARSVLPTTDRSSITLIQAKQIAPFPMHLPGYLPKGFILEQVHWIERPSPPTAVQNLPRNAGFLHFQYSDGLIALSLFEDDKETLRLPPQVLMNTAIKESERIYRLKDGAMTIVHRHPNGVHATLVGEIAPDELIKMIASLAPYQHEGASQ